MPNKKVLFICKGNWFRSQMAAAIFNKLTNSKLADSVGACAGTKEEPEGQTLAKLFGTHTAFFELMEKHGMYVRENRNKKLLPSMLDEYDIIVSMVEEPYVPDFLKQAKGIIRWEIENPDHMDDDIALYTYNKIKPLVEKLIEEQKL